MFGISALFGQESTDPLVVHQKNVSVISSFEMVDYFSTYSEMGMLLWEVPFGSKIESWKLTDEALFIFSRHRKGSACYLTCVHPDTGALIWEKNILAPVELPPEMRDPQ